MYTVTVTVTDTGIVIEGLRILSLNIKIDWNYKVRASKAKWSKWRLIAIWTDILFV